MGISDIRRVANDYLIEKIKEMDTAVAVLGEKKDWVNEEWSIFPLSLDTEQPELPSLEQFEKVKL